MRKGILTGALLMLPILASGADAAETPISRPDGEPKFYEYDCQYFFNTGAGINFYRGKNMAMEVIWDGNDVYMCDPVYAHLSRSYVKGTYEPEENRVYFEFPQLVEDGKNGKFYMSYLKAYNSVGSDGRNKLTYVVPEGDNSIFFIVNADGTLTTPAANSSDEFPSFLIGTINESGVWDGNGSSNFILRPTDYKVTTLPTGKDPEKWILEYDNDGCDADVLIDGDDVYVGNFSSFSRYYLQGKMQEGSDGSKTARFAGNQFMGAYTPFFYFLTSVACEKVTEDGDWYYSFPTVEELDDEEDIPWDENVEFAYNPEKREFTLANPNKALLLNPGIDVFYPLLTMYNPVLRAIPENPVYDKPRTPEVYMIQEYDPDGGSAGSMVFDLPKLDVNGNLLNLEKTWYEVYFDDQLKEFSAPEYTYVETPLTQIPYGYSDSGFWDIYTGGSVEHYLYYFTEVEKVAVRIIAEDPAGNKHYSEFGYWPAQEPGAGVDGIESAANADAEYYDMTGRRVKPSHGQLLIRRDQRGTAKVIY